MSYENCNNKLKNQLTSGILIKCNMQNTIYNSLAFLSVQVTISYIDEDLELEERRALLADYGFNCKCSRCIEEEAQKQVSTYKDFDVRGGLEILTVDVLSCFVILGKGALYRDDHFFYKPMVATFASQLKF